MRTTEKQIATVFGCTVRTKTVETLARLVAGGRHKKEFPRPVKLLVNPSSRAAVVAAAAKALTAALVIGTCGATH